MKKSLSFTDKKFRKPKYILIFFVALFSDRSSPIFRLNGDKDADDFGELENIELLESCLDRVNMLGRLLLRNSHTI